MKTNTDEFYTVLLLLHGPDPEPDRASPSRIFSQWVGEVEKTIAEYVDDDYEQAKVWTNYWDWLKAGGMAWKGKE